MKSLKKRKNRIFITLIAVIVVTGTVFYACKKDAVNPKSNVSVKNLKSFGGDISLVENPYSIEEYLSAVEDPDEQRLDRQLYEIGLIARDLFKDNRLNHYIMEHAGQRANDCIDLRTFKEWPMMKAGDCPPETIEELQKILDKTNLTYISKNPEVYGTVEHYIPAIFVANLKNADPNKMPIFSAGVYVNEEFPGMEEFDDYIVVWYFDPETKEFKEALMNEQMALTTSHPLFIVDNASEEVTNRQKSGNNNGGGASGHCDESNVTGEMKQIKLSSSNYKINHRYESSGKSEFCVAAEFIDENGRFLWVIDPNCWYRIAKVEKRDIGKQIYKWTPFWLPNSTISHDAVPFECNFLFWNTFERDWAKTPKDLGVATENNCTIHLLGRMKSESNWYAYHPDDVKNNPLDFAYIFHNWYKNHQNNNGNLGISAEKTTKTGTNTVSTRR